MPTTITDPGVFSVDAGGDFLDEYRSKETIEVAERNGRDGQVAKAFAFRRMFEISFKGGGAPELAVGVGAIEGITGGVSVITENEHTERNDKHDEYSASGKNYPDAS